MIKECLHICIRGLNTWSFIYIHLQLVVVFVSWYWALQSKLLVPLCLLRFILESVLLFGCFKLRIHRTWLGVFAASMFLKGLRSCVSSSKFELPPPKQRTCVQNPTSYRGWFQPDARLNFAASWIKAVESVILIKNTRVDTVGVNKTNKETFSLSGARNC